MIINNEAYFQGADSVETPKSVDLDHVRAYFTYDVETIKEFRLYDEFTEILVTIYTTFKDFNKPEKGAKVQKVRLEFKLPEGPVINVFSNATERTIQEIHTVSEDYNNFKFAVEGPEDGLHFTAPTKTTLFSIEKIKYILVIISIIVFLIIDVPFETAIDSVTEWYHGLPQSVEQNLEIPALQNYNNETKNSIYERRKAAVEKSVFKGKGYVPSETVFGGVQDKMPWISLKNSVCIDKKLDPNHVSKGPAVLSRFIENPNLLIGVMLPYVMDINENSKSCTREPLKLLPTKMTYDEKRKLITAHYPMSYGVLTQRVNKKGSSVPIYFTLVGLNSRDFGYEYATVSSSDGVLFTSYSENIDSDVIGLRDFIHVGGACGVPGGCNNISPYQPATDFYFISIPAKISFKLWKNKPLAKFMPADFNFKIIFNET